jgi:hypothetical protein
MNIIKITNLVNILWSTHDQHKGFKAFEQKLYELSDKYASGPMMGYLIFGIIFVASVLFINGFYKK